MSVPRTARTKIKMIKVTAWVPEKQVQRLMKMTSGPKNQSGLLRQLIESELERMASMKAHGPLYGIATKSDFDDRLL